MSGRSTAVPLLVLAARRRAVQRTPVWFMRQAGRVLPEYRALRERWTLVQISQNSELATEVTLQPMRRASLDAAILFADIMTPLIAVNLPVDIVEGVGPVVAQPVRSGGDVARIRRLEPERDVPYVLETIRSVRGALEPEQAVVGFAGAPFTLAAYLIEGRSSRTFARTKALMYGEPSLWHELMDRLTAITVDYLAAQARAGADVLQLFDSWIGALSPDDYAAYVSPYARRIFTSLRPLGVPLIHFGTGTAALLPQMSGEGADVIGLDWRIPLDVGWAVVGSERAVQGNLDPAVLLAPPDVIRAKAADVLARAGGRPGHIFNLGHGLLPETPLESVQLLVDLVHESSAVEAGVERS